MSDHVEDDQSQQDPSGVDEQPVDYSQMTEDELRAQYATLSGLIDELKAETPSLENAKQINELRVERNKIAQTVRDLQAAVTDPVEDFDLDAAPVAAVEPGAPEAPAAPVAEVAPAASTDAEAVSSVAQTEGLGSASTSSTEGTTQINEEASVSDMNSPEAVVEAAAEIVDAKVASVGAPPARPIAPDVEARPEAKYLAGPNQNEFSRGEELDLRGLGRAFESRRTKMQPGLDGKATRAVIAGLGAYEDDPDFGLPILSRANTPERNTAIMIEASQAHMEQRAARLAGEPVAAHTAAICEPLDHIRPIPEVGTTEEPFSALFAQRPMGRLGASFMPATSISSVNGAISVWDEDDQAAIDPDDSSTWKPCIEITCGEVAEVKAKELTTCVTVDTATEMSSPERVKEVLHHIGVQRSRRREQHILGLWDVTASGYLFTGTYGATASLFQAVLTALPQLLYPEREDPANYDLVLEPGYIEKLTYDQNNKSYTDPEDVLALIRKVTGLNTVVLRDFAGASPFQVPPTPNTSAVTLAEIPDTNRVRIVPSGAYLYAATGEESTGWQTDTSLVRQNKQQLFSAEWIYLAKHSGAKAGFIDITSVGNGSFAAATEAFGTSDYAGS